MKGKVTAVLSHISWFDMGSQKRWKRETIKSCSMDMKNSGFANLEQGTPCHVKPHMECVYRICILS